MTDRRKSSDTGATRTVPGSVQLTKTGAQGGAAATAQAPKFIRWAVIALIVTAVASLATALLLYGQKHWLYSSATTANAKLKASSRKTPAQVHQAVDSFVNGQLFATIILFFALLLTVRFIMRGRHWARWVVLGLWVVSTFTSNFAGVVSILSIGSSAPLAYKVPSFIAAVAFVLAVVFTTLRPSVEYFNANRPARPGGVPERRGLFAPRPPRAGFGSPGRTAGSGAVATSGAPAAATDTATGRDRARTKQRASAESAARGAELARARAKASKSRRSGG